MLSSVEFPVTLYLLQSILKFLQECKKTKEEEKELKNINLMDCKLKIFISFENDNERDTSMQIVFTKLLSKQAVPEHLRTLMENQQRNSKRKNPRQRRWDSKVISVCLGLFIQSPRAYEQLRNDKILVLPSNISFNTTRTL